MKNQSVTSNLDWTIVYLFIALVVMGWLNIYSSSLSSVTNETSIFDTSEFFGKQLLFIILCIPIIIVILSLDAKFYEKFSIVIYALGVLSIAGLFVFGSTVKGQTNWYSLGGGFRLQPSEFAKIATALALAKFLSDVQVNLKNRNHQLAALAIVFLPVLLIVPHDPGSAVIYLIFVLVLFREGLPNWYVWTGFIAILIFILTLVTSKPIIIVAITFAVLFVNYIRSRSIDRNSIASLILLLTISGFSYSVNYIFNSVFEQHHRDRFNILLGKEVDLKGIGYNIHQSEIAIGSGGFSGRGFLKGTQTRGKYVPEQHTDFIFTSLGEAFGFVGCAIFLLTYLFLLFRIINIAERQRSTFSRVYAYSVASILFFHISVNVCMTIGLFPIIGIALPLISYGGSSLLTFTVLIFVLLRLDADRQMVLR